MKKLAQIPLIIFMFLSVGNALENIPVKVPNIQQISGHGLPGMFYGHLRSADFDGDGKVDVFMGGIFAPSDSDGPREVRIYKNMGNFKFQLHQVFKKGSDPLCFRGCGGGMELGDFNGDGKIDFVDRTGGGSSGTVVAGMNENGNFKLIDLKVNARNVAAGDLDNDGKDEVVIITREIFALATPLYLKWDNGSFKGYQNDFHNSLCDGGVSVGDLNMDGYDDILAGGNCGPMGNHTLPLDSGESKTWNQWHKSVNGVVDPSPELVLGTVNGGQLYDGMDWASYALGDFDRDGNTDIALSGSESGFGLMDGTWQQYDFVILFNVNGDGKNFKYWAHEKGGAAFQGINTITAGDFNGDGYDDIFFEGVQRRGNPYLMTRMFLSDPSKAYNDPNRMLEVHTDKLRQLTAASGAFADFDNDGKVDLIYTGGDEPFHVSATDTSLNYPNVSTIKLHTVIYKNMDSSPIDVLPPMAPQSLGVN